MTAADEKTRFLDWRNAIGYVVVSAGVAIVVGIMGHFSFVATAEATTFATTPVGTGEDTATIIEIATTNYEAAQSECITSGAHAFALQKHVDVLEGMLPLQQARSDEAARQLYKLQQNRLFTLDMLTQSKSLDDFIKQTEYLDRIARANIDTIKRTAALEQQIAQSKAEVEASHAEAEARLQEAEDALESAYAERVEKQRVGIANSQSQDKDGNAAALDDGADWRSNEEEFVAEWAPRLDAYLAGSPLYGQGENFAKSAWKYCIDPRWSAAISNTESGKGSICIRPHNAWGWGAADSDPAGLASEWSSWEEAIDAHARGLARGYGYTISVTGAKAYCPVNWERWYSWTLSEMSRI